MMFEPQRYSLVLWDAVYSMAVGFVVGFFYQIVSLFLYKGKVAVFIKDVAVAAVFAVGMFSYGVSFANYSLLRWYNVAFGLVGWRCWPFAFSKVVNGWQNRMGRRAKTFLKASAEAFWGGLSHMVKTTAEKSKKNTQKNNEEVLKETEVLLYN